MKALLLAVSILLLAARGLTAAETPRTVTVAADGSGDHKTIQAAVDAVPADNPARVVIRVKPGTYKEVVRVPANKPLITLQGDDANTAILTFDNGARKIHPDGKELGTFRTPTCFVDAADFVAEKITFENSAGEVGQALAMSVTGDRAVFRNCRFLGWQDTLFADKGRQYFADCYLEGRVDFIFGSATAVFDRCTIKSKNGGYVTAASTLPEQPFGYVFLDCTLIGEGALAYLGRPWRWDRGSKAAVAFIRCTMGPHVRPEGWNPWHLKDKQNTDPASNTRYVEFGTRDIDDKPMDVSKRVPWSRQLTAEEAKQYTVENVLKGKDGWNPKAAR